MATMLQRHTSPQWTERHGRTIGQALHFLEPRKILAQVLRWARKVGEFVLASVFFCILLLLQILCYAFLSVSMIAIPFLTPLFLAPVVVLFAGLIQAVGFVLGFR
jgi:hypothetical protein